MRQYQFTTARFPKQNRQWCNYHDAAPKRVTALVQLLEKENSSNRIRGFITTWDVKEFMVLYRNFHIEAWILDKDMPVYVGVRVLINGASIVKFLGL